GAAVPGGIGPKPESRPNMYMPHAARSEAVRIGLPNSPSLGMSTPASDCAFTTSATEDRRSSPSACSSWGPDGGLDHASRKASGRGRLPACVVRIRSVLLLMWRLLRRMAALQPSLTPGLLRPDPLDLYNYRIYTS